MATGSKYYFLSRPRRFGKSLLISTLGELFAGHRELFKDLWIASSDYAWSEYPTICIDFSTIGNRTVHELQLGIHDTLELLARKHNVSLLGQETISVKLKTLIEQISHTNKVVILIDEYDKPILDHIENPEEAYAQREVLKSLYSVIKGSDQYLRFVLLTGVSKFAKTSIFSGINNLTDISLDARYATILGYTKHELIHYFSEYIGRLAQKQKNNC